MNGLVHNKAEPQGFAVSFFFLFILARNVFDTDTFAFLERLDRWLDGKTLAEHGLNE